jgi:hypothetical protein
MTKLTLASALAVFVPLAVCQTAPALAFGLNEELGRHSVNAMVYFRLPLGAATVEQRRTTSVGITVKSELQFAHQGYERERGPYVTGAIIDLMDVRFGMNGRLTGFEVGGLDAFGSKSVFDTVTDGNGFIDNGSASSPVANARADVAIGENSPQHRRYRSTSLELSTTGLRLRPVGTKEDGHPRTIN